MVLSDKDRADIARIVAQFGFEADSITERPGPGRDTVTVTIAVDGDEPCGLDELEEISHALDASAQHWGPAHIAIVLEVSSRGVDAPLRTPHHWRRNHGRKVGLTFRSPDAAPDVIEKKTSHAGAVTAMARIGEVDVEGQRVWLVFRVGKNVVGQWVDLEAVEKAVVEVEFSAPPEREMAALVADS